MKNLLLITCLAILLVGCASTPESQPTPEPQSTPESQPAPEPDSEYEMSVKAEGSDTVFAVAFVAQGCAGICKTGFDTPIYSCCYSNTDMTAGCHEDYHFPHGTSGQYSISRFQGKCDDIYRTFQRQGDSGHDTICYICEEEKGKWVVNNC